MNVKRKYLFEPDYTVSPGETLREVMDFLQIGQGEFAERLEVKEQDLVGIFEGMLPISKSVASRLELVADVPARFWNNLEVQYRELSLSTENYIVSPD